VGFLSAGEDPAQVRVQINRWVQDGKVIKLHKGLYTLAEPYRKTRPEKFCIANALKPASYVSLQSALSFYGLIPEYVPEITSVTTTRGRTIETPLGRFGFRHINKKLFYGFTKTKLTEGQSAFVAQPEKALLDLIHLTAAGDSAEFIEQLRLQNLDRINKITLRNFAEKTGYPKLKRACENIEKIMDEEEGVEL
jgi:predicted transcriptional regulator of viral defense system